MTWSSKIEKWDAAIRGSDFEVISDLKRRSASKVPRRYVRKVAELFRRSGDVGSAFRLLHPIVRTQALDPTPEEKVEYAALLTSVGSLQESLALMDEVDSSDCPEVLLYRTFAWTPDWEYEQCIESLTAYIEHPKADSYFRLVAMVNLCDALVFCREHIRVKPLLSKLLHDTSLQGFTRLKANIYQIAAVEAFWRQDWKLSNAYLSEATTILSADTIDKFFVEKWSLFAQAFNGHDREAINKVRQVAKRNAQWETIRECDRFDALLVEDFLKAKKVYFGTGARAYRDQIIRDFSGDLDLPENYLWVFEGENPAVCLGVNPGTDPTGRNDLKPGLLLDRTFAHLASDLYRPLKVGSLFFSLFPGEYYSPESSPARVHEAIRRLRNWFVEKGIALEVREFQGGYSLNAEGSVGLWKDQGSPEFTGKYRIELKSLKEQWKDEPFSSSQAAQFLSRSERSVRRLLHEGLAQGLTRIGAGPATSYRFV